MGALWLAESSLGKAAALRVERRSARLGIFIRTADLDRELAELIRVFEVGFRMEGSLDRFRWLYQENPDGPATAWVVVDDETGQIVGSTAVFPRRIRIAGDERPTLAWNCGDFAILQKYRTMGAAVKLRRAARDAVDAGQIAFLYAHPNDRMLAVHLRAGHSVMGRMVRHARPLRLTTGIDLADRLSVPLLRMWSKSPWRRRSLDVEVVPADLLPDDIDAVDEAMAGRIGTAVVRDRRYLEWRFGRNPIYRSQVLVARARGRPVGFLVFAMKDNVCLVKDWLATTAVARDELFRALTDELQKHAAVSVSIVALETHPDLPALRRLGFVRRAETSSVVTYAAASNPARDALIDPGRWYMTVGDRDI